MENVVHLHLPLYKEDIHIIRQLNSTSIRKDITHPHSKTG